MKLNRIFGLVLATILLGSCGNKIPEGQFLLSEGIFYRMNPLEKQVAVDSTFVGSMDHVSNQFVGDNFQVAIGLVEPVEQGFSLYAQEDNVLASISYKNGDQLAVFRRVNTGFEYGYYVEIDEGNDVALIFRTSDSTLCSKAFEGGYLKQGLRWTD